MNQRITNQAHQLSTIGEIIEISLTGDVSVSVSNGMIIDDSTTHFQVMATGSVYYRSDGKEGGVFPLYQDGTMLFTVRDFKKTYVVADSDCTLYVQALGE